jgi:hypothetical protein
MPMWRAGRAQKSGYRLALLIIGALLAAVIGPAVPAEAYVKLGCKFGGIDPTIYYSFNPVLSSIRRTATTSGAARWNAVKVPGVFVAWSAGHPAAGYGSAALSPSPGTPHLRAGSPATQPRCA